MVGTVAGRASRGSTLPFFAMLFVVALAGGVLFGGGIEQVTFPVKAGLFLTVAVTGAAFVLYRPVLFPLCAFLLLVPFDGVLQTGGGTLTKFLGVASTGVVLLVLADHRRRIVPPTAAIAWCVYLTWSLASLMWSASPETAWSTLQTVLQLFVVYFVVSLLRVRPVEAYAIVGSALAGGVGLALYSVYLYVSGSDLIHNGQSEQRLLIDMGSNASIGPNYIAAALVPAAGIALALSLRHLSRTKIVALASLIVVLGAIFITASRGAVVAIGAMWVYLMIVSRRRVQLLIIAAAGLAASLPDPSVWMRFTDPSQGGASGRSSIWDIAWIAFKQYWAVGIGDFQFRLAYAEAYLRSHQAMPAFRWGEDPQNIVVQTGVELGVVGLALILFAWWSQVRVAKAVPTTSPLYELRLGVEAATFGLFVNALSIDILFYKFLWTTFVLGLVVRSAWDTARRSAVQPVAAPSVTLLDVPPLRPALEERPVGEALAVAGG